MDAAPLFPGGRSHSALVFMTVFVVTTTGCVCIIGVCIRRIVHVRNEFYLSHQTHLATDHTERARSDSERTMALASSNGTGLHAGAAVLRLNATGSKANRSTSSLPVHQ